MTFVWYQNGPKSKHVLVGEILVMSFATRLDLGLFLCSKIKTLSCWMVSIIYEHLRATNVVVSLWFVLKLQWGFFSFWWRCGLHWRCDGSVYMHLQLCSTRQHFCNTNLFTPPSQHTSIMFHILATMALKCSLKLLMEESIMAIVF